MRANSVLQEPEPGGNRFPGRFAKALAAAFDRDAESLRSAFDRMSDAGRDRLGAEVCEGLALAAKVSGDWGPWAWACGAGRIPWSYWRAAAAEAQERVNAWAVEARPKADTPRRQLAKLAVRLVHAGTSGHALLHRLDEANATLPDPVSAEDVGEVAVWAAGVVGEGSRHAS